jgi:hypothetical protein
MAASISPEAALLACNSKRRRSAPFCICGLALSCRFGTDWLTPVIAACGQLWPGL